MRTTCVWALCVGLSSGIVLAQAKENSNLWPVYRDVEAGFRVSYPPGWVAVPPKGVNVRFSVNPPDGPGNCNVVARPNAQLAGLTQAALNLEIQALPDDAVSWAGYAGISPTKLALIESRHGRIVDTLALLGTMEASQENLEGKFTRKQMVAITLTPRFTWTLNCGATSFSVDEARARFLKLQPTFSKVFGSFAFLK